MHPTALSGAQELKDKLAGLAAAGALTPPSQPGLVKFAPVRLSTGSGSDAVSADRDERG